MNIEASGKEADSRRPPANGLTRGPRRSIIIGFGRSGRHLHLPCLQKARALAPNVIAECPIGVVDTDSSQNAESGSLLLARHLSELRCFPVDETIVHVCTRPDGHLAAIRACLDQGFRQVIVEKPLASTLSDAHTIRELAKSHCAEILVVANWHHSGVTTRLMQCIDTSQLGGIVSLRMWQGKPRVRLSLARMGQESIFDIEIPHAVSLAMYLINPHVDVLGARTRPLFARGRWQLCDGHAKVLLRHEGDVQSSIESHLFAKRRVRMVELTFEEGSAIGRFPTGAGDSTGSVTVIRNSGQVDLRDRFYDDPLTTCFVAYYRHFAGVGARPASNLDFNLRLVHVLDRARALAAPARKAET